MLDQSFEDGQKIGILTFHRAYNYGAVLQCCALNRALLDWGYHVNTIDYYPWYFKESYTLRGKGTLRHPHIRMKMQRLRFGRFIDRRNEKFAAFIDEYIPLTDMQFQSRDELKEVAVEYRHLIVGSDQVWHKSLCRFDPVFFLDIPGVRNESKHSYAASFGMASVPEEMKEEYIRRLQGFTNYSVREQDGAEIIQSMLHVDTTVNCDPTFLVTKEKWMRMEIPRRMEEPYILIYYVSKTKKLQKFAAKLSEIMHCKVVCLVGIMDSAVLSGKENKEFDLKMILDAGPGEFISLFHHAQCVLTNSFHGTAFSIIFQKPFLVDLFLEGGSVNNRVRNILQLFDLEERVLQNDEIDIYKKMCMEIHWMDVEEKIEEMCKRSKELFRKMFGQASLGEA